MQEKQRKSMCYTFLVIIQTEQVLTQEVTLTSEEEHPSTALLEQLAQVAVVDHAWQPGFIRSALHVLGVRPLELTEGPALFTNTCYYQIEFHPFDHREAFVLLPGEECKRLVDTYYRASEQAIVAAIIRLYPTAIRIYWAQMELEQRRRRKERQEKQVCCQHGNALITVYDEYSTTYTLQEGKIVESQQDAAPSPLWKVEVLCPDCHMSVVYPDWRQAPEPLRTYGHRCFHAARPLSSPRFGLD